jgi:hypothetical protein
MDANKNKVKHSIFARSRECACGHDKDYHIAGNSKCVFGICECAKYQSLNERTNRPDLRLPS